MKLLSISFLLLLTFQANASAESSTTRTRRNGVVIETTISEDAPREEDKNFVAGVAAAGEVIRIARDLVALGEETYVLVARGRPSVVTDYSPVSVLPREGNRAVDAQDLEGWRPARSFTVNVAMSKIGITFARLQYKVIYNYGGSYNGRGAYITNAQIVPSSVSVGYGTDFDATMRVSGMANRGTRAAPVATVMMQIRYKAQTMFGVINNVDTYEITGRGGLTRL